MKLFKTLFYSINPFKAKKLSSIKTINIILILLIFSTILSIFNAFLYWQDLSTLLKSNDYSLNLMFLGNKPVITKQWALLPDDFNISSLKVDISNKNFVNSSIIYIKNPICLSTCFQRVETANITASREFHILIRNSYILFSIGNIIYQSFLRLGKLIIIALVASIVSFSILRARKRWLRFSKVFQVSLGYTSIILIGRIINLFKKTLYLEFLFYIIFLFISAKNLSEKKKEITFNKNRTKNHKKRPKNQNSDIW